MYYIILHYIIQSSKQICKNQNCFFVLFLPFKLAKSDRISIGYAQIGFGLTVCL